MNKSIYRNFYYVKESIADFFQCNKKHLLISIIAIVLGLSVGLCVGIKNISCYTFINLTDKIIQSFFTNCNWFSLFIKSIFKYLFYVIIVLVLCNFNFLSFLNYVLFAYLSFSLVLNSIIIASLCGLCGILYVLLCYFLFNFICIFLLVVVFLMCKCSANGCGSSNKFLSFPIKAISLTFLIIIIVLLIFSFVSLGFSHFISILI